MLNLLLKLPCWFLHDLSRVDNKKSKDTCKVTPILNFLNIVTEFHNLITEIYL